MMPDLLVVAQQQGRTRDLGENDIQVTIAVNVGERGTTTDNRFEDVIAAFFGRNRHETGPPALSAIPE